MAGRTAQAGGGRAARDGRRPAPGLRRRRACRRASSASARRACRRGSTREPTPACRRGSSASRRRGCPRGSSASRDPAPAPAAAQPRPASAATAGAVAASRDPPVVAPPVEPTRAGIPAPTHAAPRRAAEPAPQWRYCSPAPVRAPDPVRSPLRAAMRSHLWLTGIILTVLAVGATGYWVLRVHQRIAEAVARAPDRHARARPHGALLGTAVQRRAWACAVVYRVESVCLIAKVNALGSWSTVVGQHRCERRARARGAAAANLTAAAVAGGHRPSGGPLRLHSAASCPRTRCAGRAGGRRRPAGSA